MRLTAVLRLTAAVVLLTATTRTTPAARAAPAPVAWTDVEAWVMEDGIAAGLSPGYIGYLLAVVWCEARGNPYAVGALGEVGPFQFHPAGLWLDLPHFRDGAGWPDWERVRDVRTNVAAGVWAFASGYGRHWSCA